MHWRVLQLLILSWACCSSLLAAELQLTLNAPTITEPKSLITLAISLSNTGEEEELCELQLGLPEGWETISSLRPLKVKAGATRKKLITISVPQNASAQVTHSIHVEVRSERFQVQASHAINVSPEFGVKLSVLQTDELEWMGKTAVQRYAIKNTGNSNCSFAIEIRGSRPWSIEAPRQTPPLAPGATYPLEIEVHVPSYTYEGEKNYLTVEVWPCHSATTRERHGERHRSSIEAIASTTRKECVYPTLPSTLEMKAFDVGRELLPKIHPRLRSRGILEDRYLVDMDISTTAFQEFDETASGINQDYYRVDVEDLEGWTVSVGDTRADFSYLTRDLFGKGARLQARGEDWASQAFYGRRSSTSGTDLKEEVGAFNMSLHKGEHYGFGVTYMGIREEAENSDSADPESLQFTTVQTFLRPCKDLIIEGELGLNFLYRTEERFQDHAWWLHGSYTPNRWSIEAEAYRSGTYYRAKLNDRQGYRLYSAYHWDRSTLWAEQHNYHNNLADEPDTPNLDSQRTRVGFYLPERDCLPSIDTNAEYRKEFTYADDENLEEESYLANVTLNKSWGETLITARGRWDYTLEKTTDEYSYLHLYELYGRSYICDWTLGYGAYLTLSSKELEKTDDYRLEGWVTRPVSYWGTLLGKAILTWRDQHDSGNSYAHWAEWGYNLIHGRWYVDIRLRHNLLEGGELASTSNDNATQIIGQCIYTVSRTQSVEGYIEYNNPQAQGKELRAIMTWKKDFQLPIYFMRNKAVVKGQLIAEDPELRAETTGSLAKIRVYLDKHSTYTDAQGRFSFPAQDPGTYTLRVDTKQLPTSLALTTTMPMPITLQKGEDRHVRLPVVEVASIGGTVFQDKDQDRQIKEGEEGVQDVRIVLNQEGKFVAESFTSPLGHYFFQNVKPGSYTLHIDTDYLPPRYIVTTEQELNFIIKPKEQLRQQNFGVYNKPRKIKVKKF